MNSHAFVVYGPQGCGKTRYAKQIAEICGADNIVDEWHGQELKPLDLAMTGLNLRDITRHLMKQDINVIITPFAIFKEQEGWADQ